MGRKFFQATLTETGFSLVLGIAMPSKEDMLTSLLNRCRALFIRRYHQGWCPNGNHRTCTLLPHECPRDTGVDEKEDDDERGTIQPSLFSLRLTSSLYTLMASGTVVRTSILLSIIFGHILCIDHKALYIYMCHESPLYIYIYMYIYIYIYI